MSMANKSIGSIMIHEIIRMKDNGLSNSQISKNLGKSRTTVVKYLSAIRASGFCSQELLKLKNEDLSDIFEQAQREKAELEIRLADMESKMLALLDEKLGSSEVSKPTKKGRS